METGPTGTVAVPLPYRRIGRYEIRSELGLGAMGIVYKGYDPNIGRDVADGEGIIHRDSKPANIMISGWRAKVMDFGVAKFASAAATATGTVIGTPSYMAPEAVKGLPVDGRADIFSLGVVLYEMLTAK